MAIPVNTYTKHNWVDDSSPDLEAEILNEIETGIKDNNDAIKAIAAAVVSQIINDPDKIASMAALYAVNQTLGNLSTTVTNINSNLTSLIIYNDFALTGITYATGTIGTRGAQATVSKVDVDRTGYVPISFSIVFTNGSNDFIPVIFYATTTGMIYINLYRASSAAVSSGEVTVRVAYKKI